MKCPSCEKICTQETYEEITIDVCPKCQGVWLDHGEMELIISKREEKFSSQEVEAVNRLCGVSGVSEEDESRELSCPKCEEKMKTLNYNYSSGIIVDRCPKQCGVWLDADELEKIQIHAEFWQDRLEANRDRFTLLAGQVEEDSRSQIQAIDEATGPSRFRFINSALRGIFKF
jgi:Zn-finger nucleic acid-binding protein